MPTAVPSLERGLSILELIANSKDALGFGEIVSNLGLPTASAARIIAVLRQRDYISKDVLSGKYGPGARMATLGQRTPTVPLLRAEAAGALRELSESSSCTALLVHWTGEHMHCLAKHAHEASVSGQDVGNVNTDLSRTPWGWLFYGTLPQSERKRLGRNMRDLPGLRKNIRRWYDHYSQHGYICDDQEIHESVRRIAAPVRDATGRIVAAVALLGFVSALTDRRLTDCAEMVIRSANSLSAAVGWIAPA